ncbi:hypothetical protein BD626DRAFT_478992 [Schizophyllum amplum]|uniref:TB2/DP1, HVA22 family-domain-containing protein n=1 Tax=Schizophyllum amplum TaxID=97359 RepID=A0A550CRT5_9AGAR|nr:hypothetical protein BD626DRAFT_478992 [Auriculariopsis ampla]
MSLIAPAMRVAMVCTNVWETYKTLKPPPPSPRNGGRPTLRAQSQRKRDMKGCLAVWLVFCCFLLYERLIERVISIFIPFYDELKSMAMLFLIVARARAAEPIYLHIIRPFLKPHTAALDALLDVSTMIGDLIFTVATLPLQPFIMWWQSRQAEAEYEHDPTQDKPTTPLANGASVVSETVSATSTVCASGSADAFVVSSSMSVQQVRVQNGHIDGLPATPTNGHQIWHPPPSSYQDDSEERFIPPHPDELDREAAEAGAPLAEEDEWRKYPEFPSAYPATPFQPASRTLKPEPPISSSIAEADDEPGFRQSLRTPREDQDPHSVPVLSDESIFLGIHAAGVNAESGAGAPMAVDREGEVVDGEMTVDEEREDEEYDEDEEDSFNITLQTPMPRGLRRADLDTPREPPLARMAVSPESLPVAPMDQTEDAVPIPATTDALMETEPTAPAATSHASSRTNSDVSSPDIPRAASGPNPPFRATKIAGKKRAHAQTAEVEDLRVAGRAARLGRSTVHPRRQPARVRRTPSAETSGSATSTSSAATASTNPTSTASSASTTSASDAGTDVTAPSDVDEQPPYGKRRRVLSTRSGKAVAVPVPKVVAPKKAAATSLKRVVSVTRPVYRTRSQPARAAQKKGPAN